MGRYTYHFPNQLLSSSIEETRAILDLPINQRRLMIIKEVGERVSSRRLLEEAGRALDGWKRSKKMMCGEHR